MIHVDEEVDAEEVTVEVAYDPNEISSLELHGGLVAFVVEGRSG